MPDNAASLIASLTSRGGESAAAGHDQFAADLSALLTLTPSQIPDLEAWRAALAHGFAYYYWRWDKRAVRHFAAVQVAIGTWAGRHQISLDLLCELLDFHYFLVWCFNGSGTEQCRRAIPAMRAAVAAFARDARRQQVPTRTGDAPVHIVWLAMFARSTDPMSVALRHVAPALLSRGDGFRLTIVAWRDVEPSYLDWLRGLGIVCHTPQAKTPAEMIAAIEALAAADPPEIAISDMNNAVPTALFARRLAPVQLFLQAGMPAWPIPLDGVFNSFGFDPEIAGWRDARMLEFRPPWDLPHLNPPENPAEIAMQRALLPTGKRLIGNYGRLVKVTEPCLRAIEQILLRCPDTAFVTGGTGDASALRAFVSASRVGDRMHVREGFVPGHTWGRFLEVFLDTWPVTGGESCREMIAKGRPVVTRHSEEMPAIVNQRDRDLVARDWEEYAAMAVRLLTEPEAYEMACTRASSLARRMVDGEVFAARLAADLDLVLADVRNRSAASWISKLGAAARRVVGAGARS